MNNFEETTDLEFLLNPLLVEQMLSSGSEDDSINDTIKDKTSAYGLSLLENLDCDDYFKTINPNELREESSPDQTITNILSRSQNGSPSSPLNSSNEFESIQTPPSANQKTIEQDELLALLDNCQLDETEIVSLKSIGNMLKTEDIIKEEPIEYTDSEYESSSDSSDSQEQMKLRKRKSLRASSSSECIFKPKLNKMKPTPKAPKEKKMKNCLHVWQYCRDLLKEKDDCVEWINASQGIFKIKNQTKIAEQWGLAKNRKNKMSYEKFSRGIRHSRDDGYFDSIPRNQTYGVKLVFKFGDSAIANCDWLKSLVNN